MPTVESLAQELGTDPDSIVMFAQQLASIDGHGHVWEPTAELTDQAAGEIALALATTAAANAEVVPSESETLLALIAQASAAIAAADAAKAEATARRDDLIRRAMSAQIRPSAIAAAAALKPARLYQIRDGRR